ncbi:e9imm peptide [Kitasatospora sp. NPDC001527]|uniref:e9imm peptide n=1 Tax=Kitasatospora sp. NPDC001527 TaxID=3154519 RepID=UPI0033299834
MDRASAIALVQGIMDGRYTDEAGTDAVLEALDRGLACPRGHVAGLIFWPGAPDPTAAEVVDQALGYRPFAL